MISFEDCIALCGLTEEEVAAVAEHEYLPEIAAAIYWLDTFSIKRGDPKNSGT